MSPLAALMVEGTLITSAELIPLPPQLRGLQPTACRPTTQRLPEGQRLWPPEDRTEGPVERVANTVGAAP